MVRLQRVPRALRQGGPGVPHALRTRIPRRGETDGRISSKHTRSLSPTLTCASPRRQRSWRTSFYTNQHPQVRCLLTANPLLPATPLLASSLQQCIDRWLGQDHHCPECWLDLTRGDEGSASTGGELSSEGDIGNRSRSFPTSTLPDEASFLPFSSLEVSPPPQPPGVSPVPTTTAATRSNPDYASRATSPGCSPPTAVAAAAPSADSPVPTIPTSTTNPTPLNPEPVHGSHMDSRPSCTLPTLTAATSAQQQPSPGTDRALLPDTTPPVPSTTNSHATTPTEITALNTAINATINAGSLPPVAAPFACFLDSPGTWSPSSPRTSVVRFLGLSPESTPSSIAARTLDSTSATTPQPPSLPSLYAELFDSPPRTQTHSQGDAVFGAIGSPSCSGQETPTPPATDTDDTSQPSSPALPYDEFFLDSPDYDTPTSPDTPPRQRQQLRTSVGWSPYSRMASDTTDDTTELNTAVNATANDCSALHPPGAPYACLIDSPSTLSPTSPRTSTVRFLGLSPTLERQHREAARLQSAAYMQENTKAMPQLCSLAPYAGIFDSPGAPNSPPRPVSTAVTPSVDERPSVYACHFEATSCAPSSPPPTSKTVRFRLSSDLARTPGAADRPELPSPSSHAAAVRRFSEEMFSSTSSSHRPDFAPNGGRPRGERLDTSGGLFVASSGKGTGPPGATDREREKERERWVWPLSSASIWDNKAWPAIGGRVRIASLDEGAETYPDGEGKQGSGGYNRGAENERVAEAADSTGAGAGGRCEATE